MQREDLEETHGVRGNRWQEKNRERQPGRPEESKGCRVPVPKTEKAVSRKELAAWSSSKMRSGK